MKATKLPHFFGLHHLMEPLIGKLNAYRKPTAAFVYGDGKDEIEFTVTLTKVGGTEILTAAQLKALQQREGRA